MLYLILPIGSNFGWGIVGKYLLKELSEIIDVGYIPVSKEFTLGQIDNEADCQLVKSKLLSEEELCGIHNNKIKSVDSPIIQVIANQTLLPLGPSLNSRFKVGYTFFEENFLAPRYIQNGKENYRVVVTGSKWCADVLRERGLETASTIIQGIDPLLFNPSYSEKQNRPDRFVVFSGGKFELRKGQDIVIRAFKVLHDRHADVMLINSWYNHWSFSMETMYKSPYIYFQINKNDYTENMKITLFNNGIDLDRVIIMPLADHSSMANIYQNTDIGLFPNRCEGGTNLVLMEYMACGKPAIASNNSGHKDILTPKNSIRIEQMHPMPIEKNGEVVAVWDGPDLEETISHLEWAYQHRNELKDIGAQAAKDMKGCTWQRTAKQFYDIFLKNGAILA